MLPGASKTDLELGLLILNSWLWTLHSCCRPMLTGYCRWNLKLRLGGTSGTQR
jgi:hypothetical protein